MALFNPNQYRTAFMNASAIHNSAALFYKYNTIQKISKRVHILKPCNSGV